MEECGRAVGLGMNDGISSRINSSLNMEASTSSSVPINSSNIGFQLLKKHGWKEGTGLGIFEQGRLEPVEAYVKKNKRGLGADKVKKAKEKSKCADKHSDDNENDKPPLKSTAKRVTKKMKKLQELEKRLKEKEFERAFYREFWPDNV
ncbi:uncharacterized protein [Coffea arabica]|uniref:G-patch domain-containing protein n=1 Tax=Coffea arabica TaxID=13443 RepID=A0A6P6V3U4_COFAR|nr:G patch domain and ankyrin repeat-containing protein 1 homolog [Coffea arabica]